MDDIQRNLLAAWKRLRPILRRNPDELTKRLARLHRATLNHPPRAWCLAIRATDTRLDHFTDRASLTHAHAPHALHLTTRDLQHLAAPVHLARGGLHLTDVAQQLGTTPHGLLDARLNGTFTTRHLTGVAGGGKPRPLLSADRPLDRAARSFALSDPAWSITAAHMTGRIPRGLRVTLTRVPHTQSRIPRDPPSDPDTLHPEHPLVDPPAPQYKSKRLPPPQKDFVWYKWNGDEYVGYDWRAENPHITGHHFKHQRQLDQSRETKRKRRAEHPAPSRASGSELFRGWRWLCPRCGRKVNLLFLPLPRLHLLGKMGKRMRRVMKLNDEAGTMTEERKTANSENSSSSITHRSSFACERCLQLRRFSRCDPNAWNEIVTYLSAGLLYGREVERPSWFPKGQRADRILKSQRPSPNDQSDPNDPFPNPNDRSTNPIQNPQSKIQNPDETSLLPSRATGRKIAYTSRPNRAPSDRRPQIERMLLSGMSFQAIAAKLGLVKGTILWHAQQVYKHHNVRTLVELLQKFDHPELVEGLRGAQTPEIRRRLLAGETTRHIADALNIPMYTVYNQRVRLLREGANLTDARKRRPTRVAELRSQNDE